MSCYFTIYAMKKGLKFDYKESLELITLCTSNARELASGVSLAYDEDTVFTKETLDEILDFYDGKLRLGKGYIEQMQNDVVKYSNLLTQAQNDSAAKYLGDMLDQSEYNLRSFREEEDELQMLYDEFSFVKRVIENNEGYDYYYNLG